MGSDQHFSIQIISDSCTGHKDIAKRVRMIMQWPLHSNLHQYVEELESCKMAATIQKTSFSFQSLICDTKTLTFLYYRLFVT